MKNKFYIHCRLDDLLYDSAPKSEIDYAYYIDIRNFCFWVFNNGNYRTVKEMKDCIRKYEEEMLAFKNNPTPQQLKPYRTKISYLKDFMED